MAISPSSFTLSAGGSTTLTATLKDENYGPLAGKTINWSETSGYDNIWTLPVHLGSTTTGPSGQASITYTAPTVTAQTYVTITASFAGDDQYQSSVGYSYGTITAENVVTAVSLTPPHIDYGLDNDGDGLYDYLVVTIKLNVAVAGSYSVSGSLSGGSSGYYDNYYSGSYYGGYTYIDYAWADAQLSTGSQTITLRFDGSKIQQVKVNGPYTVDLTLMKDYEWIDSGTHTTQSYTYTQFQTPAVALTPPHSDSGSDTDGDGYYNYLVVNVNLNVTRAGTYSVSGSLMGGSTYETYTKQYENAAPGEPPAPRGATTSYYGENYYGGAYIDSAWEEAELSTGAQTVKLRFNGMRIRQAGVDGPYTVSLSVYGPHSTENGAYSWDWETSDYGTHTTATYNYTDFQPLPIEFSTPHSDQPLDTDGDGLYDYLAVDAKVNVRTAGTYLIVGTIMPPVGLPASASRTSEKQQTTAATYTPVIAMKRATLSAGDQTVRLRFPGGLIYQSKQNGPYYISLSIIENFGTWSSLAYDSYTTTTAYTYTQFEPPVATFSSPHNDYGQDTDGDGLYDKLVVELNLNVRTAGSLRVFGVLMSSRGYSMGNVDIKVKDVTLAAGTQKVKLEFDGWKIYSSRVEGSMMVGVLLLDPSVEEQVWYEIGGIRIPMAGWVGIDTHTTKTYTYSQFESTAPAYSGIVIGQPTGRLSAGQATTIDLSARKLPTVRAVRVAATASVAAAAVSVVEITEAPAGVPEPPMPAISYITINVDNAAGQSFTFKLDRARIENLGIDVNAVRVYRFEDNWVEMSVEKTGEDENCFYFEVTTPGFSVFAVTGKSIPTVVAAGISIIAIAAVVLGVFIVAFVILWLRRSTREVSESVKRLEGALGRFLRQK